MENTVEKVVEKTVEEAEKHYRYAASKIGMIISCPGSLNFIDYLIEAGKIPKEESTVYSEEGVLLHSQQERAVLNLPFTADLSAEQEEAIGTNLQWFIAKCVEHGITDFETETKGNLKKFGIEDAGGTADIRAKACKDGKRSLHAFDWKFGYNFVSCQKNKQVMTYLLCQLDGPEDLNNYDEFWIHVGQPRVENFDSYLCEKSELLELIDEIKMAQKMTSHINPGQDQCRWCRGKPFCKEYQRFNLSMAVEVFSAVKSMQSNVADFSVFANLLSYEPAVKAAFKAIRDQMANFTDDQLRSFGYKRVAGRSFRTYTDTEKVVEYLFETYNLDDVYEEPKLKSPAQLEKTVKGLKKDATFQGLIFKPVGAPTIVSLDDNRPEYGSIDAACAFAHLQLKK